MFIFLLWCTVYIFEWVLKRRGCFTPSHPQLNSFHEMAFPVVTAKIRLILNKYKELVLVNYKEADVNGHFDDCTKDVLKELYVQEEEMSDSDEESAEVDDK